MRMMGSSFEINVSWSFLVYGGELFRSRECVIENLVKKAPTTSFTFSAIFYDRDIM